MTMAKPVGKDPAAEVIRLTNEYRKQHDRKPLRTAPRLRKSATAHARDMVKRDYFSHAGWFNFIKRAGYRIVGRVGENIAYGQQTAAEVFRDWVNSPEHKENILNKDYHAIGVGHVGTIWVQHFGSK